MRPATRAEEEGAGDAHELHQQDRADERALADADLGAVGRRHLDDGLDAVVVDQERQQHQERLAVAAELAKRLAQAHEGDAGPGSRPGRSSGSIRAGGSGTRRKSGIENSAHQTATDRNASRAGSVASLSLSPGPEGSPKSRRHLDPRQVERQQQPAAQIPHRVAGGRDPVDLVRRRAMCGSSAS